MSIWADCEEHDAVPFFGFPVKPSFKDDKITFDFPLGYEPNGSQTDEVASRLKEMLGGDIIVCNDKQVTVSVKPENLATLVYDHYMRGDDDE